MTSVIFKWCETCDEIRNIAEIGVASSSRKSSVYFVTNLEVSSVANSFKLLRQSSSEPVEKQRPSVESFKQETCVVKMVPDSTIPISPARPWCSAKESVQDLARNRAY